TFTHIFGYFSSRLNQKEKEHFFSLLEDFRKDLIEENVILELLKNWSFRFEEEYLQSQTLFEPYPKTLEKDT
uniref:DUF1722 domain-containing protein n=1 Tax=Thermocrinis sp. TaxID=2024383 RepID=UPI002628BF24